MESRVSAGRGSSIMSPRKWDPGEQLWVRRHPMLPPGRKRPHGISIPAQLQDIALPDCFPLYSGSESSNLTSLRQPPFSSRSTQIDKLFMWHFSVLYLLTLIKERVVSVHRVLALRQPVWHMFTLNSYRSPRKWALLFPFNREIISLAQGHTNTT